MEYTSKQINRDFRLKVFGFLEGKKINMLVGVSGLLKLIGEELMEKQFLTEHTRAGWMLPSAN